MLLKKILLGLLLIAGFCILMDLITLVYEYFWVIPIVIAVIFLIRFIVRPDFREKVFTLIVGTKPKQKGLISKSISVPPVQRKESVESLKELIDIAMADGEISEAEKRTIIRKGVDMGISPKEAEIYVNARIFEQKNQTNTYG